MVSPNSQPLVYKPSALPVELTSSKAVAGKELSLSSWCIASLYIYHFSTVIDFSSEKYSGSTGRRNSWYQRRNFTLRMLMMELELTTLPLQTEFSNR